MGTFRLYPFIVKGFRVMVEVFWSCSVTIQGGLFSLPSSGPLSSMLSSPRANKQRAKLSYDAGLDPLGYLADRLR